MKIKQVIDKISSATNTHNAIAPSTIDQLIIGDDNQEITGIITTFMATVNVINEAIRLNVNLIITHEPTWANGHDLTDKLQNDEIYLTKKKLIEDHKIAIWRFHDHMHFGTNVDMVMAGFAEIMNWENYLIRSNPEGNNILESSQTRFQIPTQSLRSVLSCLQDKLLLKSVRYIGNPDQKVSNVAALIGGASLGLGDERNPIEQMKDQNIDLAICGDVTEWTLSAYVRDANMLGISRSMVVIGHERSEEFGMKYAAKWIQREIGINVKWVDAGEPWLYS